MVFLHENALNTKAFPSLGSIQSEVVRWTANLFHGPDTAAGFLTSGGTESILCAVLGARERARNERGIEHPEMVLPRSAHAAFHKAAHLFGVTTRVTEVREDWTADVEAMAAAVNEKHRARRGSAPPVPAGCDRPDPGDRRARHRGRRQLPRRRVHGRLRPAVRRDAGTARAAVGLPGAGRVVDLRRRPQARLRPQGHLGDPLRHARPAPSPDVRVRRLVGRVLRRLRTSRAPVRARRWRWGGP